MLHMPLVTRVLYKYKVRRPEGSYTADSHCRRRRRRRVDVIGRNGADVTSLRTPASLCDAPLDAALLDAPSATFWRHPPPHVGVCPGPAAGVVAGGDGGTTTPAGRRHGVRSYDFWLAPSFRSRRQKPVFQVTI